jgi:hypothetical protein
VPVWFLFVAKLQIQGLIWGSPYIELADSTAISSDTGYTATIDYKGKGRLSDRKAMLVELD